jgi:hypothetical protein
MNGRRISAASGAAATALLCLLMFLHVLPEQPSPDPPEGPADAVWRLPASQVGGGATAAFTTALSGRRKPVDVVVVGGYPAFTEASTVRAVDRATGAPMWRRDHADLVGVVGSGASATVVAGVNLERDDLWDFDALDAGTGALRWSIRGATALWTFSDRVLSLSCQPKSCLLTARTPTNAAVLWSARIPGTPANELTGANPSDENWTREPGPMPALVGIAMESSTVLVSTRRGSVMNIVPTDPMSRVIVADAGVVISRSAWDGTSCKISIESVDPADLKAVRWRRADLDPQTITGTACQQGSGLTGAGSLLQAVRPGGGVVLLRVADGRETWVGSAKDEVIASDGVIALIGDESPVVRMVDLAWGRSEAGLSCPREGGQAVHRYGVRLVGDVMQMDCPGSSELSDRWGHLAGLPLSRDDQLVAADGDQLIVQVGDELLLEPR